MEGWVLFVTAIVVIGLVQLFALYRARSRWESQGDADTDGDRGEPTLDPPSARDRLDALEPNLEADRGEAHTGDHQICPQCGESNEIGYTYCRRCISHLHNPSQRRG